MDYFLSFVGIFYLVDVWSFSEPLLIAARKKNIPYWNILGIALINFALFTLFSPVGGPMIAPFRAIFENPSDGMILWGAVGIAHFAFILSPFLKLFFYEHKSNFNWKFRILIFASTYTAGILAVYANYLALAQHNAL